MLFLLAVAEEKEENEAKRQKATESGYGPDSDLCNAILVVEDNQLHVNKEVSSFKLLMIIYISAKLDLYNYENTINALKSLVLQDPSVLFIL